MESDTTARPSNPSNVAAYSWAAAVGIVVASVWVILACMFLEPLGYAAYAIGFAVGYVNQRCQAPPGIGRSLGVIAITAAIVLTANVVIWQLLPYFEARDLHGWDAGTILLEISREQFAGERPFLDLLGLFWLIGACMIAFCVASWPVERPARHM